MGRALSPLALASLLAAGCASSSTPNVAGDSEGCVSCGRSTVGGHSGGGSTSPLATGTTSAGSTSAGSTSSGGGSTGTGSLGGSSGSGSTGAIAYNAAEVSCPSLVAAPSVVECAVGASFASQYVDLLSCTDIANAQVTAVGADGVPISGATAASAANGNFALCLPEGVPFSIQVTAPSYPTTYYAEMQDTDAGGFGQLATLSSGEIGAFAVLFPGGQLPNTSLVFVKLTGTQCFGDLAGWTFEVALPDGGPLPDGGYQLTYLDANSLPDSTATVTSSKGAALIYNLDPTISTFLTITPQNPDAGACAPINGGLGFTGRVYVAGSALTVDPFLLP